MNTGLLWTIVAILLIIALVIFIFGPIRIG